MSEGTINNNNRPVVARQPRSRKVSRTDSEVACEEAARLTAEQEEADDDGSYCDYHDLPPPPDGGYGWVIVLASFFCNMVVDGIAYTFGVFLTRIVLYYDESEAKTAFVGSLLSGMYLGVGPIVSALANKFGCRAVCIAGGIISSSAFVLSTFSPSVNWLMLIYGIIGGFGFGLIYLPAVVCVGYYFETKRSLATGIAVCGSGVGTFVFAPLAAYLLEEYGWRGANLILAGLILNCIIFGILMRPLEYPKEDYDKPLLQRMAEERRIQMERGSLGGSYFMVQLPDGTMEKRQKQPLNIDPGVHSSLNLDQLASAAGGAITPIPTVPTLPTITEARVADQSGSSGSPSPIESTAEVRAVKNNPRVEELKKKKEAGDGDTNKLMPRNASQPAFTTHVQGLPKNGSVPTFDRIRKTSVGERFKPTLVPIKQGSRSTLVSNGEMKNRRNNSASSFLSRNNNSEVDVESLAYASSRLSLSREKSNMVRPMSRKDIFYSRSVTNLPEYQSQKSLANYRQSIMSIPRPGTAMTEGEPADVCPCLALPDSFKSTLSQMLDVSLLKNPVFVLIGISNLFANAGLYIPFVYIVNSATTNSIPESHASLLLSVIGITNTIGRIACGYFADFPQVDALFVNNCCLITAFVSVAAIPFCHSFGAYITVAIFFGIAVSGYISLTSIILVDLLGLDKLTNAFGLLSLFRGLAAMVGSPMAGALLNATGTYDLPFYVGGGLFGIAAIFSFTAPCLKRCLPQEDTPIEDGDALAPIDEDEEEEEEDEPITMGKNVGGGDHVIRKVPRIIETVASPNEKEIQQIESVL